MKKNYKYILWDIDDTLIDFKASESVALKKCFANQGVMISDEDINVYSKINRGYWKLLEEGKVEKSKILEQRFIDFIKYLNLTHVEGAEINQEFQSAIGDHVVMFEHGLELCKYLKGRKKQYAVTNGTQIAQEKKLRNTGLDQIFDGVFISDLVGYQKPDKRFFDKCFQEIPDFHIEEAMIIGDSLSSDIQGANNVGMDCCWFNPKAVVADKELNITYNIRSLKELDDILK